MASKYRSELQSANSVNNGILNLINDFDEGIEGKTCGVLSKSRASGLLGGVQVIKDIGSRQGVFEFKVDDKVNYFWADSCLFEDINDSNRYVEIQISTYSSAKNAEIGLNNALPKVGDKEEINDTTGDRVIYSSGVYYLLNGKRVVQIAASNGNPLDAKTFVESIYSELISEVTE